MNMVYVKWFLFIFGYFVRVKLLTSPTTNTQTLRPHATPPMVKPPFSLYCICQLR
jgi:hypothetical protein